MRAAIALLVLAVVCAPMTSAQWVRANVPRGGDVHCLGVSGSTILAATNVGLLRSTDNGISWERSGFAGTPWGGPGVTALASSGKRCFAGTYTASDPMGGGVWCSTDEGVTWEAKSNGLPNCPVTAVAAGPVLGRGATLFATIGSTIFRSTDNGERWDSVAMQNDITALAVFPDGHGGSCVFTGTYHTGIFASTDEGTSWARADSGLPHLPDPWGPEITAWAFAGIPDGRGGMILFAGGDGVYRSTDMGKSWTAASAGLPGSLTVKSLSAVCDADGDTVLLAGGSGPYRSTDYGNSWTTGIGIADDFVWSTAVSGNGTAKPTIIAGTSGLGIYRSTDTGISWEVANEGLFGTTVASTAVRGTTVFAGTYMIGVFRSTDYGMSWTATRTGMPNVDIMSIAASGPHIMALTSLSVLYTSHDDAASWTVQGLRVTALGARGNLFVKSIRDTGVFISSDYGSTWVNAGLKDVIVSSICFSDSGIFAATSPPNPWESARVYSSTDQGKKWTYANTFPLNSPIRFLQWCRSSDSSKTYLFAGTGAGVFRSTDDGLSWAEANKGLTYTYLSAFAIGGNCLFVGIYGPGGVFVSTDYGEHWRTANTGLSTPYPFIRSFAVITDGAGATTILAPVSGNSGMWRVSLKDLLTSLPGVKAIDPTDMTLCQNYPNPFNPSTTIRYGLPQRSHVNLAVCNTLGQQVTVLQNGEQEAGYHDVKFDASNLPSGVYFYRLQAGSYVETRKLLLVR